MPDYPDFTRYSYINVIAQELSQIINRFKYGAPDQVFGSITLDDNETEKVIEIKGKGQVYTSMCYIDGDLGDFDKLIITMDGEELSDISFASLYAYRMTGAENLPISLTRYSLSDGIITAVCTPGYTFETQYKIEGYHGGTGSYASIINNVYVYYTLIGP